MYILSSSQILTTHTLASRPISRIDDFSDCSFPSIFLNRFGNFIKKNQQDTKNPSKKNRKNTWHIVNDLMLFVYFSCFFVIHFVSSIFFRFFFSFSLCSHHPQNHPPPPHSILILWTLFSFFQSYWFVCFLFLFRIFHRKTDGWFKCQ